MRFTFNFFFVYLYHSFFNADKTPRRLSPRRLAVLAFIFFVFPFWHLYLRLGYLLDKVFFPAYQEQEVSAPIFIIGNYRSGTTFLHRLLLKDEQLTCLKTWEIYFAPAVTYRKLFKWINDALGGPLRRLGKRFDQDLAAYAPIHKTGMEEGEEDSQVFFQILSSYNMFALFPFPRFAKKYIYYDERVSPEQKENDMGYYREVLRRHVFLSGGKRYVSKNPDFSPRVEALKEYFPDAKFINIVRTPAKVVPSTINMWSAVWSFFGSPEETYPHKDILIEHAKHWYQYPHQRLKSLSPDRYAVVEFSKFVANPKQVITQLYDQFGLDITEEFAQILQEATEESRQHKSSHSYSLDELGLDEVTVMNEFTPALEGYEIDF